MKPTKVMHLNGIFQQWQGILNNRNKRTRTGKFFVQGVRPINMALTQSLEIDSVLCKDGLLSDWAKEVVRQCPKAKLYVVSETLMKVLGEKKDDTPELLLIAKIPKYSLDNIKSSNLRGKFILALDRPQSPGNIGAVARSADALGAGMIVITGHSADVYDPKSVRASRGSLFSLPIVTSESPADVQNWIAKQKDTFSIIGLSEDGDRYTWDYDLKQPTVVIVGNETWGLSKQWKETCDSLTLIPMQGTASSLNASSSAAIMLYEYARQSKSF